MPSIKTREIIKGTVKTIDRTANLTKNTKNIGVRSKDTLVGISRATESASGVTPSHSPHDTPDGYATDKSNQYAVKAARYITKSPYRRAKKAKEHFQNSKRIIRQGRKSIKGMMKSAKVATKTSKAVIKTTKATVKSGKIAVKTTATAAKATAKSAAATAKTAKMTAIAAKLAIKKAIIAIKIAVKITIVTVKATIAIIKGLIALIAAGGWIVVLIIVIIAVLIAVISHTIGFFRGDEADGGLDTAVIVSRLTTEFYEQIAEIEERNPHDTIDLRPASLNWAEILAVHSVRMSAMVYIPDDMAIQSLRDTLHSMAWFEYYTTVEIIVDEESAEESQVTTLRVTLIQKTPLEIAEHYAFDLYQLHMLSDMLSPDFAEMWAEILGGFSHGAGQILQGNPDFIPQGIFSWPLVGNYPISSPFGWRTHPITYERSFHGGIDIAAPFNAPILAMADGVVIAANGTDRWGGGWGFFVKIQHEDGYVTLYAHCSSIAVNVGQEVVQGEVIAFVGTTGQSTGYHLHFEIHRHGTRVNPLEYFAVR